MDDKELGALVKKTAEMLFGPPQKGKGGFALWKQFDPELAKHLSMFVTGRLYAREVLSQKQRELCACAALAALNLQHELYAHMGAALRVGATREEVAEVLFQVAVYAGVPCLVEGMKTLRQLLQDRGEWVEGQGKAGQPEAMDDKQLADLTRKTAANLFGAGQQGKESVFSLWSQFDPVLARHLSMFVTGRLYAREVLSQKSRELCACAALAVRNLQHELHIHLGAAMNVGATRQEAAEVLFQIAVYAGVPALVEGMRTLKEVLEERGEWVEKA
jgi:4-carboxymuconolactone decarboxylase